MPWLDWPPGSAFGWTFLVLGAAVQVYAVLTILRDVRGRRITAWDVAALAFVVVLGPCAALIFVSVHGVLEDRGRRKDLGAPG